MNSDAIPASIEISPKHALEMPELEEIIPGKVRVYLADVGTHETREMARACERLIRLGLHPVPHFAARRLRNLAELEDKVKRYTGAGVFDVLVVGGSPDRRVGDIYSTMQVLETGLLDANGVTHIGIAGHPEGSPDFSEDVAAETLRLKKAFAERTGARMRIVTQFGFDPDTFIAWADGLKGTGIDLPVHLGVAGPAKVMTLLKYAAMCGVGNSINFLKKRARAVTALASSHSPESMIGPIEKHIHNNPATAIRGVHVFPFGGLKQSSEWLVERGSWSLGPKLQAANHA
jgi:methylenetetrahydrofolate reductase (NADH)